ncbi:MAG: acyl-CoA dehydrogenase family protein, partial [Candidatus Binatia bacterium]
MDPFLDQDHKLLRDRIRSWTQKNLAAQEEESDVDEAARRLIKRLGEEGFTAYVAPKKFGGTREQVQARDLCLIREELA